jgi:hypothetical protein
MMDPESFPILTSEREVKYHRIDPAVLKSFKPLPLQHHQYFVIGPTAKYVLVSRLVFSRARPEGIANANALMREAAAGRCSRRAPISVRELDDGRLCVTDGNSTAMNALLSGWPDIPADIDQF